MNKELLLILGERLKEARTRKKLTQKEFVEGVGIGSATLSAYEKGTANPSIASITAIAQKHNLSLDWLMGLKDNESTENRVITYYDLANLMLALSDFPGNRKLSDNNTLIFDFETVETDPNDESGIYKGEISFYTNNSEFYNFFSSLCQMSDFVNDSFIKKTVFNTWVNAAIEPLKEMEIKKGAD